MTVRLAIAWVVLVSSRLLAQPAAAVSHPFAGVMLVQRTETAPRPVHLHVVEVDLQAAGIAFRLTPPGGSLETVRQTTAEYLAAQHAQLAINVHFFLPFPSDTPDASLIGLAASDGHVYSAFEAPVQSYALVTSAPAINLGPGNQAAIVHRDTAIADGMHVVEHVTLGNVLAGSAQIVTDGVKTIPHYRTAQDTMALLTPGGPTPYSETRSWYDAINARTAVGLTRDGRTLVIVVVDRAGGSDGMTVGEVADLMIHDYGVYNALNLDGGGSSSLAMEDPLTHVGGLINASSDNPAGRKVGSNLAIFARPAESP